MAKKRRVRKTAGIEALHGYLDRTGKTQSELAIDLGVGRSEVSHILSQGRMPSLRLALVIQAKTGVPVTAWQ